MVRFFLYKIAVSAIFLLICVSASAASISSEASSKSQLISSFWESPTLTGEWGGLRKKLEDKGVTFPVSYTIDVLGNPVGGASRGAVYTGSLMTGLNIDFQKLIGWEGGSFGTQWIWLSGQDLTQRRIHNMFPVDNMAGFQTFRLNSLWLQQNLFSDKISLRAGILSIDGEFENSAVGSLFLNGAFGWSPFFSNNILNGGPGYPMGAPGVRLAINPVDWFTYQAAIAQGDIFPQNVNRHGFRWRLNNGFLFIQEAIFHLNPAGRYWGNYRIGSWILNGKAPSPSDEQVNLHNNYGFYLMGDQMLIPTSEDNKNQGLATFGHIAFAPPHSNVLQFYVDGGLTYTGLLPFRPNDSVGIAIAYGQLSNDAIYAATEGLGSPRHGECVLEATYRCQVTGWMTIQPDIQYIMQPGGPGNIPNAFVVGFRGTVTF